MSKHSGGVKSMNANWANAIFREKMTNGRVGEKNPNWKGGNWKKKSAFLSGIRNSAKYIEWKNKILERDVKTYPNIPKGLQVHHIKSLERLVYEHDVKSKEEAMSCAPLWDLSNGATLTKGEHLLITWMNRKKRNSQGFVDFIKWFINTNQGNLYDWCREKKSE